MEGIARNLLMVRQDRLDRIHVSEVIGSDGERHAVVTRPSMTPFVYISAKLSIKHQTSNIKHQSNLRECFINDYYTMGVSHLFDSMSSPFMRK